MYNLYYLKSSLDNRIYIGITKYPAKRYKDHLRYSIKESHYNGNWIRKTLERGGEINMIVICSNLSADSAMMLEKKMISMFRKLNIPITNTADGGLGFNHKGIPHSEEHKKNIELAQPHKVRIPKEILYDLYVNKNLSKKSIGKLYNCGSTTIGRRLNEYKIPIRKTKNYKASYKIDNEKIIDLYTNQKITLLQIAKMYNIGVSAIKTLLNREKVKIDSKRQGKRRINDKFTERLNKIKELLNANLLQKDIAKEVGICEGYLSGLIKNYLK